MGDCRTGESCYICGFEADRTCERCEEYICEECQASYNQFSQIDYDCCKRCADAACERD